MLGVRLRIIFLRDELRRRSRLVDILWREVCCSKASQWILKAGGDVETALLTALLKGATITPKFPKSAAIQILGKFR